MKANIDKCHFLSSLDIASTITLELFTIQESASQKLLGVAIVDFRAYAPYVPTCLRALRDYAPDVPTCICAFVSQITTWLRAYVPYVPTCLRALFAYMPLNFMCLRAYMPTCLNFICLRTFWFYVPACLSNLNYVPTLNCVLMCPKLLRAYTPKKYRVINFNLNVMFF